MYSYNEAKTAMHGVIGNASVAIFDFDGTLAIKEPEEIDIGEPQDTKHVCDEVMQNISLYIKLSLYSGRRNFICQNIRIQVFGGEKRIEMMRNFFKKLTKLGSSSRGIYTVCSYKPSCADARQIKHKNNKNTTAATMQKRQQQQ